MNRFSLACRLVFLFVLAGFAFPSAAHCAAPPPLTAGLFNTAGLLNDDELETLAAWRADFHVAPASHAAEWPQFVEMAVNEGRWDLLEGAARDVLAAPSPVPPVLAGSARLAQAAAYIAFLALVEQQGQQQIVLKRTGMALVP